MWLQRFRTLTDRFDLTALASDLETLERRRVRERYRIAIVGRLGRGKSLLVNRLAGKALLPLDQPTSVPVSVFVTDEPPCIEIEWADDRPAAHRNLDEAGWSDLLSGENELPTAIRVCLGSGTALPAGLELVDTPPAVDSEGAATMRLGEVIRSSDLALLVVSATAPMGAAEIHFLEEEIQRARVGCVLVVVTKLDAVPRHERNRVLTFVRERTQEVCRNADVVSGPGPAESEEQLDQLRELLIAGTCGNSVERQRDLQFDFQLYDLVREAGRTGEAAAQAARRQELERVSRLEETAELAERALRSGEIQLELERRRKRVVQQCRDGLSARAAAIARELEGDLRGIPESDNWIAQCLSRLEEQLEALAGSSVAELDDLIQGDYSWLRDRLREYFDTWHEEGRRLEALQSDRPEFSPEPPRIPEYKALRRLAKAMEAVGQAAVPVLIQAAHDKLPDGESAKMRMLFDVMVSNKDKVGEWSGKMAARVITILPDHLARASREKAARGLAHDAKQAAEHVSEDLAVQIQAVYEQLFAEFQDAQRKWRKKQFDSMEREVSEAGAHWDLLTREATSLADEISDAYPGIGEVTA
ncbi:dynamin family protein [Streptomyces sp. NPDC001530]|uniref:dynamin family protein n=1 Tax=Streptomyces sp. NPDC001530 TaxID=3364582 RepID=UPI003683CA35